MDNATFVKNIESLIEDAKKTMISKGAEYAGNEDRLANFKRGGNNLGVEAILIWAVYFNKHIDSINSFVKNLQKSGNFDFEKDLSEKIEGRFLDALNYVLLGHSLIQERRADDLTASFVAKQVK